MRRAAPTAGLRRTLVLALFAAAALPAAAQPTAVFELDDYLDPRLLGSEISDEGKLTSGNRFVVVEALAGSITDFEHQGFFTDGDTRFAHLVARYYRRRHQVNLLATAFEAPENRGPGLFDASDKELERARSVPDYRIRLQYGNYTYNAATEEEGFVDRLLWSAGYEQGADGESIYNLGVALDIPVQGFLGTFGYDWRIVEDGFDQHRLLYYYAWKNQVSDHVGLPFRWSWGGERTEGHWRWAPIRFEAGVELPLRFLPGGNPPVVRLTYAPSYRVASRGFEEGWNHEIGVALDALLVVKLLTPPR